MKNIYALLLCFSVSLSFSQDLYVDNNSYIFAQDIVVFVNDDIRLENTDSYFYLRGDAQLLQNTDIKNSDIGQLSVYQEQTVQVYEYNYWGSPVGVGVNSAVRANLPFDHTNVYRPADATTLSNVNSTLHNWTTSYDATAAPNYELSERWLYKLIDGEGYLGWDYVENGTDNVATGYGFTLKGSPVPIGPLKTLDFRGRPNNGNITLSLNYDGTDDEPLSEPNNQVSTLIGNPYPSALDLKLIFRNSASNQTNIVGNDIYFWQQSAVGSHVLTDYEGGYAVYTPGVLANLADNGSYAVATFETYDSDGGNNGDNNGTSTDYSANNSGRYAAIGQGFLVNGDQAGGTVELDNSMRLYLPEDSTPGGNGSIFRTNEEDQVIAMSHNGVDYMELLNNPTYIPEIRIHTHINETYFRENVIAFRDGTDTSYNQSCDAIIQSLLDDDAYLLSDNKNLVIKSVSYGEDVRIPLVLKSNTEASTFSITVNSLSHVDNTIDIFVYDNLNDVYTNIKEGVFTTTLSEGEYINRFEITFNNQDTLDLDDVALNDFNVFQDNNNAQLTILNPNSLDVKSVSLFDVTGKRIFSEANLQTENEYRFSTKNLSDGVYVATVSIKDKKSIQKKVIIKNK